MSDFDCEVTVSVLPPPFFDVEVGTGLTLNQYNSIYSGIDTGLFYLNTNPSGFITGIETGNFYTKDNPSGFITGIPDGTYYPNDNPSGYITGVPPNLYYPNNNPSGFITGVDIAGLGVASLNDQTGVLNIYSRDFSVSPETGLISVETFKVNYTILRDGSSNITGISYADGRLTTLYRSSDILTGVHYSYYKKRILRDGSNNITGVRFEL